MKVGTSIIRGDRVVTVFPSGNKSTSPGQTFRKVVSAMAQGHTSPKEINAFWYQIQKYGASEGLYQGRDYLGNLVHTVSGAALDVSDTAYAPFPDTTGLRNEALGSLNRKARGSLDLGQDIAELPSTLRMFRDLGSFEERFQRGGFFGALARNYLTTIYGIMPLLQSFYGAATEMIDTTRAKTRRIVGRSQRTDRQASLEQFLVYGNYFDVINRSQGSARYEIGVELEEPDGFDISRWSTLNPVGLAWQLLPSSFVIDWFFDVGGYLRNLETGFLNRSRFRGGWETLTQRSNGWYELEIGTRARGSYGTLGLPFKCSTQFTSMDRKVLTGYPLPDPPSFKVDLGSGQVLSLAAQAVGPFQKAFSGQPVAPRGGSRTLSRTSTLIRGTGRESDVQAWRDSAR